MHELALDRLLYVRSRLSMRDIGPEAARRATQQRAEHARHVRLIREPRCPRDIDGPGPLLEERHRPVDANPAHVLVDGLARVLAEVARDVELRSPGLRGEEVERESLGVPFVDQRLDLADPIVLLPRCADGVTSSSACKMAVRVLTSASAWTVVTRSVTNSSTRPSSQGRRAGWVACIHVSLQQPAPPTSPLAHGAPLLSVRLGNPRFVVK
jgi:hypothetical protein